jgi:hypothetical protein
MRFQSSHETTSCRSQKTMSESRPLSNYAINNCQDHLAKAKAYKYHKKPATSMGTEHRFLSCKCKQQSCVMLRPANRIPKANIEAQCNHLSQIRPAPSARSSESTSIQHSRSPLWRRHQSPISSSVTSQKPPANGPLPADLVIRRTVVRWHGSLPPPRLLLSSPANLAAS